MTDTSDDDFFLQLQREYLAELPTRLAELHASIARLDAGDHDAAATVKTGLHRLAGSGGSYGFSEISRIARELEQWIANKPAAAERSYLDYGLRQLIAAMHDAGADVDVPPQLERAPAEPAHALVVVSGVALRARIIRLLESAGYRVRAGTRQDPPTPRRGERIDLLVIAGEAGEGDPSAIASAWTSNAESRPRAVLLIETLRAVDRLRATAAGIDMVMPVEQVDQALPPYAATLARIGAPPARILLVEADTARADALTEIFESAHIRVVRCLESRALRELLEREIPDLVLVGSTLADLDPAAVTAIVRQDRRFALHPVLFLGDDDRANRIAALRAGADDFVPLPAPPDFLLQIAIARAERGRRVRELVYRDPLTGLLNNATLLDELDYAVAYERRHGGVLAFVVFEVEHPDTANNGPQAIDDSMLLHVANVFRAHVRASDIIGRSRGGRFGMVLRGGTPEGAAVLAGKLHRVLGEYPYQTPTGETVPLRVRFGTACFPMEGLLAADLARAADQSLRQTLE